MNDMLLKQMAKELAQRTNAIIDLPFLSETDEEAFFYFIILNVLHVLIGKMTGELEKIARS